MKNHKRQIILDTETTGINKIESPHIDHRIIEIGGVEIINRRFTGNNFHVYLQPDRLIEYEAFKVHGITNTFLLNKPYFKDIAKSFLKYINGSELIIHNASFDLGFIDQEFQFLNVNIKSISILCSIIDTLKIARKLFPGKKNTLDALCTRYKIKKNHRTLHSAIVDAQLLGKLYLLMSGGQESISFFKKKDVINHAFKDFKKINYKKKNALIVLKANTRELMLHEKYIQYMKERNICLWS